MEGGTYHNRHTLLMRNLSNSLEIRNIISRISNSLHINRLSTIINSSRNIIRIISRNELRLNSQPREKDLELVISTTVQIARGNNVIASVGEGGNCHELGCLA